MLLPVSDKANMGAAAFSENSNLDGSCKLSVTLWKVK